MDTIRLQYTAFEISLKKGLNICKSVRDFPIAHEFFMHGNEGVTST